ncbi:unnamed protein product, partial [Amoebophrya sp. A25]
ENDAPDEREYKGPGCEVSLSTEATQQEEGKSAKKTNKRKKKTACLRELSHVIPAKVYRQDVLSFCNENVGSRFYDIIVVDYVEHEDEQHMEDQQQNSKMKGALQRLLPRLGELLRPKSGMLIARGCFTNAERLETAQDVVQTSVSGSASQVKAEVYTLAEFKMREDENSSEGGSSSCGVENGLTSSMRFGEDVVFIGSLKSGSIELSVAEWD